jgi:exopolysaccharide biosynthesis WecB/TagA/CpsF family protein
MRVSRIAFYMHDLSGGGVERMRLVLIEELRARGLTVTLVLGRKAGECLPQLPADLQVVELGSTRMLGAVWPLAAFLRAACPDVLISSLDHNNVTALLAARWAGVQTRVIICQHNALSAERELGWKYRAVPWLYRWLQAGAHGVVAVSRGVADDLAATARIPRARITTIYNPVVGKDFATLAAAPVPHPWLADKTVPVFVFVGRLTAQKDPQTLLEAFALLLRSRPARLILVGNGVLLAELFAQAARLRITAAVAFVGFQDNPLPWIAHADALVCCSRYEGLGNVVVEALACGTPVIACDCPHGPYEILLGGLFGQLVPVGDEAALAAAMEMRSREAVAGITPDRDMLRARAGVFTARACAEAHLALFDRLAPPSQRPVLVLGMRLSPLPARQVIEQVMQNSQGGEVKLLVTPNLHHVRLLRDPAFADAYRTASLVCPDGYPVLAYARCWGLPSPVRVTGCDLFHQLAGHPDLPAKGIFLVVDHQATAAAVADWARRRGLTRIDIAVPGPNFGADPQAQRGLAAAIRRAAPDILVMALGAPVSELFVHRQRGQLPPCWALCVGQAVKVEIGLTRRAPSLFRRYGLEAIWRLLREPRRLARRYASCLAWFPFAVLRDLAGRIGVQHPDAAAGTAGGDPRGVTASLNALVPNWVDVRIPPAQAAQWLPAGPARSETRGELQNGR